MRSLQPRSPVPCKNTRFTLELVGVKKMRKRFDGVIGIGVKKGQARDQAYPIIIQTIIQLLMATVLAVSMTSCALDRVLKADTEKPMTPTPISTTGSRR